MLTLLLVSSFIVTCSARAANDVAAQPRNIGRDPTFKRVCYYTNWSQYRKQPARFFPFNIDPFLCTHLIFAFAKIDFKGHLAPYEWNDIQYPHLYKQFTGLKKKNPHLKTLLAVGGWTHGSRPFTDMVKTPEGRKSFIEQSVQYLRAHNFDGIDLDWEYPANRGSPADDKKKFSLLVMELRDAYEQEAVRTGKERLLLTAAVAGGEKIVKSAYEVPVINKYLDFINLMSYDLNGAWSKVLGINAPLYKSNSPNAPSKSTSVDEVVQLWLDLGATRDKLVMGIPTYGRSFTLCSDKQINVGDKNCGAGRPSPFTREKGFVSYYEMSKYLQQDWTRVWLEDQMVPYAYNLRLKQWVGYDDIQSVKLKAQYIKHRQLAGAMVWAVDLDDFGNLAGRGEVYPLSKAIREVLEDSDYPAFTPPPKVATTKQKSKSTQKPEKDTYKREKAVAKKNKSSKFNNMNTVRKSPFKPFTAKRTSRTWTSRSTTTSRRPTTHSVTKPRRATSKMTPTTVTTTPTSRPTTTKPRRSTHRVVVSSRRSPYKKPETLKKLSTRQPSIRQRGTSTSTVSTTVTSTKSTRRPTSRRYLRVTRPTRPSYRRTSTQMPFYLRSIPTRPTHTKRVTPSLPPVMSTSPKHPQWVPIVITTKGVNPTKIPTLKKSSHDLKKHNLKNSLLSRKVAPKKKNTDKAVGVKKTGNKPSYRKSPYTPPPSYFEKQASFPGAGVNPSAPTKVSQLKWPSKKVINVFQTSTLKSELSSFETVSSPKTTNANVRRVTKPTKVNVVGKPSAVVYDHDLLERLRSTTPRARYSLKSWTRSTTTPSTSASTSTTTTTLSTTKRAWKPPYSFKPWSKSTFKPTTSTISSPKPKTTSVETDTTVSTSSSTASVSITSTSLTTTSAATSSILTSTTLLSTRKRPRTTRRPRYTFKPWSRTTRRSTTPETTTTIDPTTTVDTRMRAAMFKPRLTAPTMTSRISTSLPKFRPWTKTRTFTTPTSQKPSSTKAFFLFAHLTKPTTTLSRKQTAALTTTRSTKSSKQVSRSTVSQTTKPTTKLTTNPPSRPTAKPTTKPSTRPTRTSTTKPSRRPTTVPATKPPTRPTTTSRTRPTIKLTTRRITKLTTKSTTSTSPPTTSASTSGSTPSPRRTTRRPRPSTRTARKWKLTATPSAIVKIIKEKTFPMRRTTEATKVTLPPKRTTPRFTRRHPEIKFTKRGPARNITSSTPDLRAGADADFATSTSTHKPTAPTTTIRSRSINLKQNDGHQDSDYRRARKSTTPNPTAPQKIFAWMTAKTTKSFTTSEITTKATTTKATTRPKTTPTKTTQSMPTSTTTTPTTTKTSSTSTSTSPATTTRTSTLKQTTHSLMEAGLGLDHTHPNVKFSSLTKGVRKGFVNNRRGGMRFFKRPYSRVTPPRLATPPPPTDRAYVLSVPKSDCDHQNDVRQPNVQEPHDNQKIQRPLIMNTDYIPRRPKLKKRPHHGFIVENLKNNLYRKQERNKNNFNYKIAAKKTRPQRIYSTNVRYNVPSRNSFRQTRPQVRYNIPSRRVTQPQKIVIDYRVPRGKYDTVQQNLEIKAQEKRPVMDAREKENFNKFAIPEFRCPSVFGIFPDRSDCHSFYQCVWFVPFHHMCGKGTVWNDTMKICDWPQSVTTCST